MKPTPILILSDSPSSTTGLGRITRDLATRIHAHLPEFRVGTLGYGGPGSRALNFPQYHIHSIDNWIVPELPDVWSDFAGGEKGVILTIWDPSRLRWLTQPSATNWRGQPLIYADLAKWVAARPCELWGYIPVDAVGPQGRLTAEIAHALRGYDRILAYSEWAARIIDATLGAILTKPTHALPHGLDPEVWKPYPKAEAKAQFRGMGFDGLTDDSFLIGIVATNQPRKDYGLAFEAMAKLIEGGTNVRVWIHTDTPVRYWNIMALIEDHGMLGRVVITTNRMSDEQMAWLYSACDITMGIGLGEGFGYPIFESVFCGTPCIHGDYGGAAEWLPNGWKVHPETYRLEGQYNNTRPVFDPHYWAAICQGQKWYEGDVPEDLKWPNLWPNWAAWLKAGLK